MAPGQRTSRTRRADRLDSAGGGLPGLGGGKAAIDAIRAALASDQQDRARQGATGALQVLDLSADATAGPAQVDPLDLHQLHAAGARRDLPSAGGDRLPGSESRGLLQVLDGEQSGAEGWIVSIAAVLMSSSSVRAAAVTVVSAAVPLPVKYGI